MEASLRRRTWFSMVGGAAALAAAALMMVGIAGLAFGVPSLTPWLASLLGINAGKVAMASLHSLNPIDIVLLVLAGFAYLGWWPGPGKPHRAWLAFAVALPFAGIVVLFLTQLWGRSGLMGGGLVLSILMLAGQKSRALGALGVAGNLLLLVGDFGTSGSASVLVAAVVGVGYVLLAGWFSCAGALLCKIGPFLAGLPLSTIRMAEAVSRVTAT